MTTQNTTCYCGNRQPYEDCCMRIHLDQKQAQTAEQLMRARYSAFAVQDINFLYESFYVATRGFQNKKEMETKIIEMLYENDIIDYIYDMDERNPERMKIVKTVRNFLNFILKDKK